MVLDDLERDLDVLAGRIRSPMAIPSRSFSSNSCWGASSSVWLRRSAPSTPAGNGGRRGQGCHGLAEHALSSTPVRRSGPAALGPGLAGAAALCWAFARDEALLVEHAKGLKFAPFGSVLSYWSQLADPEGV